MVVVKEEPRDNFISGATSVKTNPSEIQGNLFDKMDFMNSSKESSSSFVSQESKTSNSEKINQYRFTSSESSIQCPVCHLNFARQSNLKHHILSFHKGID